MSAAQGDAGAEGLDLDAIEEHARAVKAFVNDDGDELPEDVDGLLTVLGATEVMADDLADTVLGIAAEVRRLRAMLAPVQEAAAYLYRDSLGPRVTVPIRSFVERAAWATVDLSKPARWVTDADARERYNEILALVEASEARQKDGAP